MKALGWIAAIGLLLLIGSCNYFLDHVRFNF